MGEVTRKVQSGVGHGLHMRRKWGGVLERGNRGISWRRQHLKGSLAPGSHRMRDSSSPRSGLTLAFKNQREEPEDDARQGMRRCSGLYCFD